MSLVELDPSTFDRARSMHASIFRAIASARPESVSSRPRTISKNLTFQYNHTLYQIQSNRPDYTLRNAQVTVCENAKGEITVLYNRKPLAFSIYQNPVRQAQVVDTKTLDHQVKTPKSPASDHPWRQYGQHINGKPIQQVPPNGDD